jgi:hypothetical protein
VYSAEDLGGSLFLMLVYGYFLLQGASLLSDGSELLLEVLDPGIVGGVLPSETVRNLKLASRMSTRSVDCPHAGL